MTVFVKDGGSFREISELFVRDSTSYTNKTITNAYVYHSGAWREIYTLFTATSYVILSPGTTTITVPSLANAIHIEYAIAGGGGGNRGQDYDKQGNEQGGPGGGSGAYASDLVFSVTGGETLTAVVGAAGAAGSNTYTGGGPASGGTTSLSGTSSNAIFSLTGGGSGTVTGGGVQGPLSTLTGGTAGEATITATRLTTGTTTGGLNITSFTSGPLSAFNQAGDGAAGANGITYPGDNANGVGANGADSYNGNVSGGSGGAAGNGGPYESSQIGGAGTRGSGGGGGGTEQGAPGGAGGPGEMKYRFIRIT